MFESIFRNFLQKLLICCQKTLEAARSVDTFRRSKKAPTTSRFDFMLKNVKGSKMAEYDVYIRHPQGTC